MKDKKKSIRNKVVKGQIIFGIILCIAINIVIGVIYRREIIEDRAFECFAYAKIVAAAIDGDSIRDYYETGEKDDYYYAVLDYLNATQKNADLLYLYVYVPEEHEIVYIWDADGNAGNCDLGTHEKYMKHGEEVIKKIFRKDPIEDWLIYPMEQYGQLCSANYPIFDSDGEPVAVAGVDLSLSELIKEISRFLLIVNACIILIVIISIYINLYVMGETIIKPIYVLKDATSEMVNNLDSGEDVKIEIKRDDEFGELASAYETMHKNVRDYMDSLQKVTSEKERIASELNVATEIQADMLPNKFPAFPDRNEFNIYATMTPAKEVGGDFYDFFLIDDNHLALVMADVSGKGVPAALFMVIAKTMIKNRALTGGTPAEILESVNRQLCEENDAGLFVTTYLAIIELDTGKAVASNAGHEYPVVKHKDGEFELLKRKHSPAIAAFDDVTFFQYEFDILPGDRIYLYTDGVPEATNSNDELFGIERMLVSLNARKDESLENILAGMKADIEKFVDTAPQFDDMTMLCFEYYGKK